MGVLNIDQHILVGGVAGFDVTRDARIRRDYDVKGLTSEILLNTNFGLGNIRPNWRTALSRNKVLQQKGADDNAGNDAEKF
ncbi:MAG: hypothetical protein WCG06_05610 [Candidatus Omnitrophota bacterium]